MHLVARLVWYDSLLHWIQCWFERERREIASFIDLNFASISETYAEIDEVGSLYFLSLPFPLEEGPL